MTASTIPCTAKGTFSLIICWGFSMRKNELKKSFPPIPIVYKAELKLDASGRYLLKSSKAARKTVQCQRWFKALLTSIGKILTSNWLGTCTNSITLIPEAVILLSARSLPWTSLLATNAESSHCSSVGGNASRPEDREIEKVQYTVQCSGREQHLPSSSCCAASVRLLNLRN